MTIQLQDVYVKTEKGELFVADKWSIISDVQPLSRYILTEEELRDLVGKVWNASFQWHLQYEEGTRPFTYPDSDELFNQLIKPQ